MNRPFNKRFNGPRLPPEAAARQGQATRLAISVLGSADAVRFLNSYEETLGDRPIDLAIKSAEGLAAVEGQLIGKGTHPHGQQ